VFDDMTEQDWEHGLGGVHAVVWDEGELVGHASVIQRRMVHRERALRTGYVEAVAVRADRRGRGHGAAMMHALEGVIRAAYELGAVSSSEEAVGFYAQLGWAQWRGATYALTPAGRVRTEAEDDGLFVLDVARRLALDGELTCDWRDGEVW
jgi:aminoglycoside 2'-N-acetyltransferase I